MGAKVSTRRLPDTASKAVLANKANSMNQLPSQSLKTQYEKHAMEQLHHQDMKNTNSEHQNTSISQNESTSGTKGAQQAQNTAHNSRGGQVESTISNREELAAREHNMPEGKDGHDPQMSPAQERYFIESITQLGKQVHASSQTAPHVDSLALKQLKFRKSLFLKGQKELEHQKDPQGPALHTSDGPEVTSVQRTMLHPRTIGAILKDLEDPRMTNEAILRDYQLAPEFLKGLGCFKVASTIYIEPKEDKEGEITTVEGESGKTLLDYDGASELDEKLDKERVSKLKSRLGMDE